VLWWQIMNKRWSNLDLSEFSRLMKVQLESGLSISYGFSFVIETMPKRYKEQLISVVKLLEEGESISVALTKINFPDLYISMIQLGELHGELSLAFAQCEQYYQQKEELKSSINSALSYPLFILIFAFVLFGFFMAVLLPQFISLYKTIQVEIPSTTKNLLNVYTILNEYKWFIFSAIIFLVVILYYLLKKQYIRKKLVVMLLSLPLTKKFFLQKYTYLISFHLSIFMKSGIPLLKGFELLNEYHDLIIQEWSMEIKEELLQGKSLGEAIANTPFLLKSFKERVVFYERIGNLDNGLEHYTTELQKKLQFDVKKTTKWLEPILISVTGIFVFLLVYTLFSPIMFLMNSI